MKSIFVYFCFAYSIAAFANGGAELESILPESVGHHKLCNGGFCVSGGDSIKITKGDCHEVYASGPSNITPLQMMDAITGEIIEGPVPLKNRLAIRIPASGERKILYFYDQSTANFRPCD